jgi:hypothetical protein
VGGAEQAAGADDVTVWAVEQGNATPGVTVCLYDNEPAALRHVEMMDGLILDYGAEMYRVVPWSVLTECRIEPAPMS